MADVVQSKDLSVKYTLNTSHLPGRTTEEVLEYLRNNLEALSNQDALPKDVRSRVSFNIHYALNELETRVPEGSDLQRQLNAARDLTGGDRLTPAAVGQIERAVVAFEKARGIDPAAAAWPPEVFQPSEQINRFRRAIESLSGNLGRVQMSGYDAPDFRQQLPNVLETVNAELRAVTVPSEPRAKQVFDRSIAEVARNVNELVATAKVDFVNRPDIVASGEQTLLLLAQLKGS